MQYFRGDNTWDIILFVCFKRYSTDNNIRIRYNGLGWLAKRTPGWFHIVVPAWCPFSQTAQPIELYPYTTITLD